MKGGAGLRAVGSEGGAGGPEDVQEDRGWGGSWKAAVPGGFVEGFPAGHEQTAEKGLSLHGRG